MIRKDAAVSIWLIVGLVMVYFQIIIGGVTRLTGSGLSITKWEIVTGTFPPISEDAWIEEFDQYKGTPQYQKINDGMLLGDHVFQGGTFKFIYFWEYFHRLWARSMGFVFIFPFIYFLLKKKLSRQVKTDLLKVVGLAGLAAVFGWIMVASGLVNRPWVNAYKLSIHLSIGISVFVMLWWTFLSYLNGGRVCSIRSGLSRATSYFIILVCIQIFFGGIMSGMKASLIYPTWPDIGGEIIPSDLFVRSNWSLDSFINYDAGSFTFGLMHFIHRGLAYLIVVVFALYFWRYQKQLSRSTKRSYWIFGGMLFLQIILGIVTLLGSIGHIPVLWGVLHQGVAVIALSSLIYHYYLVSYKQTKQIGVI